ncbi:MAG TPA: radical SAM protein, partial [Thermoanaerobaculia bacterium]|nr:radical SAM protein [Thermoanaerobaculia bacterium]
MLLIYPPAARSTEPPLGIARLAGFLARNGVRTRCLDLCREGLDYLLGLEVEASDTWTRGALRRRGRNHALLRDPTTYATLDRYCRAVRDLNRALKAASAPFGVEAGLADYRDSSRSPLRRADLLAAAAAYESSVFFPHFRARITEALAASPTRTVGISVNFLSQALSAFAVLGFLKTVRPDLRVVLGGGLITSWVAQGSLAADEGFGGLVNAILAGRGEDGILALLGAPRRIPDAAPDFDDLLASDYLAPTRILPYNFSTGCPWKRCSFCPENAEARRYVGAEVNTAAQEIRALVSRHAPGLLHFTDTEIAPRYLRALAASPPGVPWYGFARFSPLLTDADFCRRLAASGCVMLQLGLESADQQVLDALGKGTRLDQIDRALGTLADARIGVFLYLLFGTPAEERDAALRTRDFVASRADRIAFLNVALFNLPVGSAEARHLDTKAFYEGELALYR